MDSQESLVLLLRYEKDQTEGKKIAGLSNSATFAGVPPCLTGSAQDIDRLRTRGLRIGYRPCRIAAPFLSAPDQRSVVRLAAADIPADRCHRRGSRRAGTVNKRQYRGGDPGIGIPVDSGKDRRRIRRALSGRSAARSWGGSRAWESD